LSTCLSRDLYVDQSALTGESFPVEKHAPVLIKPTNDLPSVTNLVFAGTSVVSGSAKLVVLKTGKDSMFGAIAEKISSKETAGEFVIGINKFSTLILKSL
jgi:Mg2+-importing ATPase